MKARTILLTLATLAFAAATVVPARAGDDDDVARDSSKKKQPQKVRHVITNEDLPPASEESPDAANGKDGETKAATPTQSKADLEKELDQTKKFEEGLKKKLEQLQKKADEATDPFRRDMYLDSVQNQQITLKELHEKRLELEKKVAASKDNTAKDKEKEQEKPQPEN